MKRVREDEEEAVNTKEPRVEVGEEEDSVDEFASYPSWAESATDAEFEALMQSTNKDGIITIRLTSYFPCKDCEKWTPHSYVALPADLSAWVAETESDLDPPGLSPRTVKCLACKSIWNHQVNFGARPTKRSQLLRLTHKIKEEQVAKGEEMQNKA